jgi:hypothetical protein
MTEERVDDRTGAIAAQPRAAGIDEAAADDATCHVHDLGHAARVALDDDRDQIEGLVAGRAIEHEHVAGLRDRGAITGEPTRLGPGEQIGTGHARRLDPQAELARPRERGLERIALVALADERT